MEEKIKDETTKNEERKILNKRNIIIIISILLAIAIIASVVTIYIIENDKNYEIEEIKEYSYFKLYQNELYGVIDNKANIIIEPKYKMIVIPNPSKDVFICYSNYETENNENEIEILNSKNEKILTNYEEISPFILKNESFDVPYEKSVLKYKENDKYGIINYEGKKITEAIYDDMQSILYKEGCLIVKQNEKYGVINIKGKKIVDICYDSITVDGYYSKETKYKKAGFIIGIKEEENYKYGYIDFSGNKILKVEYDRVNRITEINDEEGIYLITSKNKKLGINKNNKKIVDNIYENIIYNNQNEVFLTNKDSKQGLIDKQGKEIVKTNYDYIQISGKNIIGEKDNALYEIYKDGTIEKKNDTKTIINIENTQYDIIIDKNFVFGLNDKQSNVILETNYSNIEYLFDDYFAITKDGKVSLFDAKENIQVISNYNTIQKIEGKSVIKAIVSNPYTIDIYNSKIEKVASMENAKITLEENYITLYSATQRKYFDNMGNEILNNDILDLELYAFVENEKWGFKDKNNNIIVDANYDMVTELNSYGFAGIKKDDKWGVIDSKGNIIVDTIYEIRDINPNFIGQYYQVNLGYENIYIMQNSN